jgi:hypothetical protein
MDEKYLSSLLSKYMDAGKSPSLDWLYRPVDDVDRISFDTIVDYPSTIFGEDRSPLRESIIDALDSKMDSALKGLKKTVDSVPLHKKSELTLAETVELFKKGYRPYVYCSSTLRMVELTLANENDHVGAVKEFLLPMMANKINERYEEIDRLEVELHQQTVKIKNEIAELHERIQEIKDNGTDLII